MSNLIFTPEHLAEVVEKFRTTDAFVFDVETRPGVGVQVDYADNKAMKEANLNWRTNEVYWLSMATYGECYVIPMQHHLGEQIGWEPAPLKPGQKKTAKRVPVYSDPPEQMMPSDVFPLLKPLFFDTSILKANHNIKFDLLTVAKYFGELPPGPYMDTVVMAQLLNENRPLDLGYLTTKEFKYTYEKMGGTLLSQPFSKAGSYSFLDSRYTWLLYRKFMAALEGEGLTEYNLFESDITDVLVHMEYQGAPVRTDEIGDLDVLLLEKMDVLEAELYAHAGQEFLLTAPADKGWFIYEVLGHEPIKFTPKKQEPSVAEDALQHYAFDPMVSKLMEWDDLHKLHSTYVLNYAKFVHRGRIHTNYKQAGARTGRFSSNGPNLQNVPKPDTDVGKQIRGLFWAGDEDECLVVGDYSQIELRVMAHFSGDPTMCAAFDNNEDIHQASADRLGTDRSIAKNINFAIPFGAGPTKIAAMGGGKFSVATAKKFYEKHKEDFPRVWAFIDRTKVNCHKNPEHVVYTILGRKRRLPEINRPRSTEALRIQVAMAERQAVNTVIQGSAADLIKKAMIRIHDMLDDDMHLILQVHDELVVTTPRAKADRCIAIMREAMEGEDMQILKVPVTANIKAVDRWSEAK